MRDVFQQNGQTAVGIGDEFHMALIVHIIDRQNDRYPAVRHQLLLFQLGVVGGAGHDHPLLIQFGRSLAQDLTISLAWSLFALCLIAAGFDIRSARVRMAGLALLGITLLKAVCYDISSLSQLYRVGALVGLAFIVLVSSFLYQKFNLKMRGKRKNAGKARQS